MSYTAYGSIPDDQERFALLDRAMEMGATFWDTSDLYGDSEELLGKWFSRTGRRSHIFLPPVDSSAAYCKKACAESLLRLWTDYIDLYYLHIPDPRTPIEETVKAMAELQAEGKIKHIGLSCVSSDTLRRACKVARIAAVQTEYSIFSRNIEGPEGTNLLATCRELGVAIVISCPLGRGLLTSTFSNGDPIGDGHDMRPIVMPIFSDDNREQNIKTAGGLKALADRKNCTLSQLALAWLLKQGNDIFPIPGTKRMKYLEENWGSLRVSLSDEEEAEIIAFSSENQMAGDLVPEKFTDYIYRDTVQMS
ncbi:NADP-dependent oxidoreductase domain-containing protein [Aspergillus ambiguus]|uniref:putative aldo-keto reductase (AKR13) n=1 Tax=Aspergillus ambiguus TaxID=176160 RepID=UPI003CCE0DD7